MDTLKEVGILKEVDIHREVVIHKGVDTLREVQKDINRVGTHLSHHQGATLNLRLEVILVACLHLAQGKAQNNQRTRVISLMRMWKWILIKHRVLLLCQQHLLLTSLTQLQGTTRWMLPYPHPPIRKP